MTYYSSLCLDVSADQKNSLENEVEDFDPLADLDLTPIYRADDVLDLEATNCRSARSEEVAVDPSCVAGLTEGLV